MCKIMIFGGTTEGRLLADFCERHGITAIVSVVSDYGKELLRPGGYISVSAKPMDAKEMETFFRDQGIGLVVDATHPYASFATENIKTACKAAGIDRIRCLRAQGDKNVDSPPFQERPDSEGAFGMEVRVCSMAGAVSYLECHPGTALVTTGSRELEAFCRLEGFQERLYVRVLPSSESLKQCEALGFKNSHIICMHGPFSEEMNIALIHQVNADFLITKESGAAGGFAQKMSAAGKCGIPAIVVERPPEQGGMCFEQVCDTISQLAKRKEEAAACRIPDIALVGIGPGGLQHMSAAAVSAVEESQAVLGAKRVLQAAEPLLKGKEITQIPLYMAQDVVEWLDKAPDRYRRITILFSGDTGFYSGAKKLTESLREKCIPFRTLPGISSVSYLAAKLGVSWEDAGLYTSHGRELDVAELLRKGAKKLFILLSGDNGAGKLCERLCGQGFETLQVSVGERLSYPNERVVTGTAKELSLRDFGALSLIFLEGDGSVIRCDNDGGKGEVV